MVRSDDPELMEEDEQDTDGTDVAHAEKIDAHHPTAQAQRAVVGELADDDAARNDPAKEQAREEPADGKEYLAGDEIEKVEQRHAEE